MNEKWLHKLKEAVGKNLPFVVCRLPGDERAAVIIQRDPVLRYLPYNAIEELSGFIMAPFRGSRINHMYHLNPDDYAEFGVDDHEFFHSLDGLTFPDPAETAAYEMTQKEYLDRASYLIEVLKDGGLRKVVMSRVINHPLPVTFRAGLYLQLLMNTYPKAFVYLARLPGMGVWVGATPEVLLSMKEDHAETVALAGTKQAENFRWTEKEIKEQQIVMDYLEELFHVQDIHEYGKTGPYTAKAGNLVHLKTRYNLSLEELKGRVGELLAGLHPTPAVCGLPRNKAYELIRKVEKHDRRFYTGFLGPWNLGGHSRLYVNLRCAELYSDTMSVYVGGGFTADSRPETEWDETVRKSETLLAVVEKS